MQFFDLVLIHEGVGERMEASQPLDAFLNIKGIEKILR